MIILLFVLVVISIILGGYINAFIYTSWKERIFILNYLVVCLLLILLLIPVFMRVLEKAR